MLPFLLEGLRNKEIADRLNSSIHTVKHHVSSILAKAGCSDRLLLVAKAGQSPEGPKDGNRVVARLPGARFRLDVTERHKKNSLKPARFAK